MHYENYRDHEYLAAFHLEDGDRTLTIERVTQGVLEKDGKAPERVPLVHFREVELPLILNSTNGKMIHMMYGTPDVRQWVGKRVTLTRSLTTDLSGNPVMGIRVHPSRPEEKAVEETPEEKMQRLEAEMAALKKNVQGAVAERPPAALPAAVPTAAPVTAPEVTNAAE